MLAIVGGGLFWVVPAITLPALVYRSIEASRSDRRNAGDLRMAKHKAILEARQESILDTARRMSDLAQVPNLDPTSAESLRDNLLRSQAEYEVVLEAERQRI